MLSIITATFNCEKDVKGLIENIAELKRLDQELEWVVIDGGSTDATVSAIKGSGLADYFVSERDFGIFDAFNKGVVACKGEYYVMLGADDRIFPDHWLWAKNLMLAEKAVMHVFPVLAGGKVRVPKGNVWFNTQRGVVSNHSAGVFIETVSHKKYGLYSSRYALASDHLYIIKAHLDGARISFHGEHVLGSYSLDGSSAKAARLAFLEIYDVMLNLGYNWFVQTALLFYRLVKLKVLAGGDGVQW